MIKMFICDDDMMFLKFEEQAVNCIMNELYPQIIYSIYSYNSGQMLFEDIVSDKPDIIFLDIDIGAEDGFNIAKRITHIIKGVKIIFVTNYENLVYEAFGCMPIGFIRKRNYEEELKRVIPRVIKLLNDEKKTIFFGKDKKVEIPINEIRYIDVFNHNLEIDCGRGIVEIRDQLVHYIEILEKNSFVMISRNCIVNMQFVNKITSNSIILLDGTEKVISRSRRNNVISAFQIYKLHI